ncbi:unnamed protein product [Linum tenue]|uniref:Uncharacterized protein n=1 Tax=Linum tenue TaxID=586396 RepID=A0AAV0RDT8_9ROSI|nr:unnamed protein product [Linum tenue]
MADGGDESQTNNRSTITGGEGNVEDMTRGKGEMKETTAAGAAGNWVNDLQRSVVESKDSALRSANSFRQCSSLHFRSLQDHYVPDAISNLKTYEDAFFTKLKDGLTACKEYPATSLGVVLSSSLLLMRGPSPLIPQLPRIVHEDFCCARHSVDFRVRRSLTRFHKAEKSVKEFGSAVDEMKRVSEMLRERAAKAEKGMKHGYTELMGAGNQIQSLSKSVYKVERQAADLVDGLREIPSREALKLRLEVASMVSDLKKQRTELDKRILKISELGVPV